MVCFFGVSISLLFSVIHSEWIPDESLYSAQSESGLNEETEQNIVFAVPQQQPVDGICREEWLVF